MADDHRGWVEQRLAGAAASRAGGQWIARDSRVKGDWLTWMPGPEGGLQKTRLDERIGPGHADYLAVSNCIIEERRGKIVPFVPTARVLSAISDPVAVDYYRRQSSILGCRTPPQEDDESYARNACIPWQYSCSALPPRPPLPKPPPEEPPKGIKLRFEVGARVEVVGLKYRWRAGTIVKLWLRENHYFVAPYQVQLDEGRLDVARRDDDSFIRALRG